LVWHARFRGEDLYHHIYAWGNDHHPIFKEQCHYGCYLSYLEEYSIKHNIDIIAYALMRGHVHLFIHDRENNISEFMLHLHGEYAKYYNWSSHRVGHVFGERYNNKIVKANEYGIWLTRYIHRQAVKKGMVCDPEDYPWTSYHMYVGMEKNTYIYNAFIIDQFGKGNEASVNYRKFVLGKEDGPIDWSLIERDHHRITESIEEVLKKMNVNVEMFAQVEGRRQREERHNVIKRMVKEHGLKTGEVAKLFNMTRAAVCWIVRKK